MLPEQFRCFLVQKSGKEAIETSLEQRPTADLPPGDVTIKVKFSSLNFKDALAATGNPAVVRKFPHVPGIDAAGTIFESSSPDFKTGDTVLVTGYGMGADHWGGWSDFIRVPAEWVIPLPNGLTTKDAMALGTAGFTAAQSVQALLDHNIKPDAGEIVVTGSTGGVGSIAVSILAKLGFSVVAVSGKADKHDWLKSIGATRIIGRDEVHNETSKPLLPARWAAAIDTVGGDTLATLLRSTQHSGCVTACGLVGGTNLNLTVLPFILRGVNLAGIDSAECPRNRRLELWGKLAGEWKLDSLTENSATVPLSQIDNSIQQILAGKISGRVLVDVGK